MEIICFVHSITYSKLSMYSTILILSCGLHLYLNLVFNFDTIHFFTWQNIPHCNFAIKLQQQQIWWLFLNTFSQFLSWNMSLTCHEMSVLSVNFRVGHTSSENLCVMYRVPAYEPEKKLSFLIFSCIFELLVAWRTHRTGMSENVCPVVSKTDRTRADISN